MSASDHLFYDVEILAVLREHRSITAWDRDASWDGDFCACGYELTVPRSRRDANETYAEHVLAELRKLQNGTL